MLLLHDVFAHPHSEIGDMLGGTERQPTSSAGPGDESNERTRTDADLGLRDEVLRRFLDACAGGDMASFLSSLTQDAELIVDGGATIKTAARHRSAGPTGSPLSHLRHGSSRRRGHVTPSA